MKFIGGPSHGQSISTWMTMQQPAKVWIDATVDGQHLDRKAMMTHDPKNPRQHTYYRTDYWRKHERAFSFYASAALTTTEIDNLARKVFR